METPLIVADFMEAHFNSFNVDRNLQYSISDKNAAKLAHRIRAVFSQSDIPLTASAPADLTLIPGRQYHVSEQVLEQNPELLLLKESGARTVVAEGMNAISVLTFINAFAQCEIPVQDEEMQQTA